MRAGSGEEALRRLLGDEFALILLDVQMPGLDGFQTADLIKQRERNRHIPIIFLTAISKDAENVFKGYESGAVDYLLKPFDPDVLRTKVAVFVELWQKTVELGRQAELLREQELAAFERESEARYRFLGDSIPQQVWTALPSGNLDYVNERVIEYFGRSSEELLRTGWDDVIHPDDVSLMFARWSEALATGDPYESEFRIARASDGAWRWHLARALPMRDETGGIVRWFGTNTDVDDRRAAEDRQRFLAEAGWVLGSSLDYARTLQDAARLAVPRVADFCAVDVLVEGRLERLALVHVDPLKLVLVKELEPQSLDGDGAGRHRRRDSGGRADPGSRADGRPASGLCRRRFAARDPAFARVALVHLRAARRARPGLRRDHSRHLRRLGPHLRRIASGGRRRAGDDMRQQRSTTPDSSRSRSGGVVRLASSLPSAMPSCSSIARV